MNSTSIRRRLVPAVAALALAVSVTACAAGNESDAGGGDGGGGDAVTLDGGGATSQAKAQGVWRAAYQDDSGNTVNYEEVGSGTGRENFNSGAYVFAGSDSYMNDDEGELSAAAETCGSDPIEVPAYVSPIAVAFNLEGVDSLNMSAETIANVFNGTITKWNDDAIAADNDGVEPAGHRDRGHPPVRRLGHHDELHGLPLQGQRRRLDDRGRRPVARGRRRPGPRGHLRRDRRHHRHRRRHRLRRRQRGQGHRPRSGLHRRG